MTGDRADRLRQARIKAGFSSAAEACEAFGWKEPGYRHHENGTRSFGIPAAERYGRAFKVRPQWLLGMDDQPAIGPAPIKGHEIRWVPLIGRAPAGDWREAIELPIGEVAVSAKKAGRNAFAVEIDGDSMNMILPEGGWAVVDPDQRHFFDGRVYLVMNGEHEATLKRYRGDPARLVPVSTNPDHKEIHLTGEAIHIVGRVVAYGNDQGL